MSDTQSLTVSPEVLLKLHDPTPVSARKTRPDRATWEHRAACPGKGCPSTRDPNAHVQLTYVDARYVMQVLDTEVGPGNWQDEYAIGAGGKVGCRIGIYVEDRGWVWKGDGAGETDIEGEKGSFSDAFKRAAVKWGIARDLYGDTTTQGQSAPATVHPAAPVAAPQQPVAAAPQPLHEGYEPAAAQDPLYDEGKCPTHGLAWVLKPGGVSKQTGKEYNPFWTCPSSDRPYCRQKPSRAFVARQEVA